MARPDRTPYLALLFLLIFLAFTFSKTAAGWVIDYQWWKELGQVETLYSMILYGVVPVVVVGLLGFGVLWVAHARGMKTAGASLRFYPLYGRAVTVGLLLFGYILAAATVDNWTAVLYVGGRQIPAEAATWTDPVFGNPLSFYLFDLPFFHMLLRVVLVFALFGSLVFVAAQIGWTARMQGPRFSATGGIEFTDIRIDNLLDSKFLRAALVVLLVAFGIGRYLDRYDLLTNDHVFMVGVDYVDERFRLPLLLLVAIGCFGSAVAIAFKRPGFLIPLLGLPFLLLAIVPRVVHSVYVRPNEISIQKPYINRHIEATRAAYGLNRRTREVEHEARLNGRVDLSKNRPLLENIRLWDWRAFHDTVTQIQALRPYYVFADTDVDRYRIDGQLRQVMLTPRELDVRQLTADARSRWINPHFVYTHGYGLVLADANKITADGLPILMIQDAPPEVNTDSLKLTRPELYYGEVAHDPVFVRTAQQEFNYPSGSENVHTRYEGRGGFPIDSFGMRLVAAVANTDWNILLTNLLTPESRMMIRRNARERVTELAGFLTWDRDPYLVITREGRLMWVIDGYTTSDAHPYSRMVRLEDTGTSNYMRNSVKATVDAYDGTVNLYIFDPSDPIVQAYAQLFPSLLRKAEEMPADLREHVRYPEVLFRVQAEMYRNFHMKDPEAFYNKEDAWDIARGLNSQEGRPVPVTPTYVVATLPGETKPEFLLLIPFTPRNKDNLIGFMAARCDGEHLGELLFLQLSKQELIFGPMQIEARINQDQNISKDLSLWNQQGSQVLRGQMLVLPVEDTFVYVEPIYIQASQARMPQLKKIVIAVGNTLIYEDTYEQALAALAGARPAPISEAIGAEPGKATSPLPATSTAAPAAGGPVTDQRLDSIRRHLQRYRELSAQGKWAEAGRALEALEAEVRR